MSILLSGDSYKAAHQRLLPPDCTLQYGNWTGRSFKYAPEQVEGVISFGQQYVIKWIHDQFEEFFKDPSAVQYAQEFLSDHLNCDYNASHFQDLWELGYLPIVFKSLPEGVRVPAGVPIMTWYNTHDNFAWLPLFLETVVSNQLWKPMTSATIADCFKKNIVSAVKRTDETNMDMCDFMMHGFAARGMSSVMSSQSSGAGLLTACKGSDNLPAIKMLKDYYSEPMAGFSVNASEHSVSSACMAVMSEQEMIEYYNKQYPKGILSIVADTFDLTKFVKPEKGGYLLNLKEMVLARESKIIVRPDSSPPGLTPADIICGHDNELSNRELEADYPEFYRKGLIECLWDIFGGTVNDQGFKVLDPHIGAIYGEAISISLQKEIYQRLEEKGFAATNILLGIGSMAMNFNTRDTLGFAAKGTYCEIDGKGHNIFKDPITDGGTKKSAKGLLKVTKVDNSYVLEDQVTWEQEKTGELKEIYRDGKLVLETTLQEIRERLAYEGHTKTEFEAFNPMYSDRTEI